MIVPLQRPFVTADEFEQMPDTKGLELIDGHIREVPSVGMEASIVASRINRIIGNHVEANRLGWVCDAESELNCFPNRPNHIRKADVSFIRYGRFEDERPPRGRCPIAPDLVVEVISPSNSSDEMNEKLGEYLAAGVRLVWYCHVNERTVTVFHADGSAAWLTADKELSGEDVLPGFAVRVADLFPPPPPTPST